MNPSPPAPETVDPYREVESTASFTLTDEERELIAATARWMTIAGAVGLAAVFFKFLAGKEDLSWTFAIMLAIPGLFAGLVLEAGLALRGVRNAPPGEDYRAIARSLGRLHIVFKVKGIFVFIAATAFGLMLLLPFLL